MFTKRCLSLLIISILLIAGNSKAIVWFDDGLTHQVNYTITDETQIWNNGSNPTTVNLQIGSNIHPYNVSVYENSNLNIYGGYLWCIYGRDTSKINIQGGETAVVSSCENNIVTMSAGLVKDLGSNDYGYLNVTGGIVNNITGQGSSKIEISGGKIKNITAYNNAEIVINGSHFRINDVPVELGYLISPISYGLLTGKLKNGDTLAALLNFTSPSSSIILIPEPSTLVFLYFGYFFLNKTKKYD